MSKRRKTYNKPKVKGKVVAKKTTTGYQKALPYKSCWEDHKPMPIKVEDTTYYIGGGSCHYAPPKGTDIFIGFDHGMRATYRSYPWMAGTEFLYHIADMTAPKDPKSFKELINYIEKRLIAGENVHIGCIGGHGRTGTILAALYTQMTGDLKGIDYVRKVYCEKAVETNTQIDFLHKYFGIKKVEPTKDFGSYGFGSYGLEGYSAGSWTSGGNKYSGKGAGTVSREEVRIPPLYISGNILGENAK